MAQDFGKAVRRLGSPTSWKVGTRRVFVMTAPVSVPLWLLMLLGANLALGARDAWTPIAAFWSAPPKRLTSNYYDYHSRGRRSDKVIELPLPDGKRDAA